jgi:phage shock protein PspC (stress-responsive transcriptional regulator)
MKSLKQKLSSRKLWAAVVGVVTGLAMVFGLDEGVISSVAGAVVSVASVITYIITEGRVDAAAVKQATDDVQEAVSAVTMDENGVTATVNSFDSRFNNYE